MTNQRLLGGVLWRVIFIGAILFLIAALCLSCGVLTIMVVQAL